MTGVSLPEMETNNHDALQAISVNTARIANTLEWIAWAAAGLLAVSLSNMLV